MMPPDVLAAMIDHAVLKPNQTEAELDEAVAVVEAYNAGLLCVPSSRVARAREQLSSQRKVGAVVGFPHGTCFTVAKVAEIGQALTDGADEIDMVVNVPDVLASDEHAVYRDLMECRQACGDRPLKVIFETAYLSPDQIVWLCGLCVRAEVPWVKTSTGFAPSGATVDDVALMNRSITPEMQVKASGGIRSLEDVQAMVAAGATRIGTSSTASIIDEARRQAGLTPIGHSTDDTY